MGDKIRPWKQRLPKKPSKRSVPLRSGDERVIPMKINGDYPVDTRIDKQQWDRDRW